MAKALSFHSDYSLVTIICNGVPVAVHGEVDIVVRRPAKLGRADQRAWDQCTPQSSQYCSAELIDGQPVSTPRD